LEILLKSNEFKTSRAAILHEFRRAVSVANEFGKRRLSWIIGRSEKCHFPHLGELGSLWLPRRSCRNPRLGLLAVQNFSLRFVFAFTNTSTPQCFSQGRAWLAHSYGALAKIRKKKGENSLIFACKSTNLFPFG